MSTEEALYLRREATGKTVLEIGSFCGFSTVLMAEVATLVVAVDWHRGDWAHLPGTRTLDQFMQNLEDFDVLGKVVPVVQKSELACRFLRSNAFDLAFVDGNHDAAHVQRDAILAKQLVKSGGFMVFHDYDEQGVMDGLDEARRTVGLHVALLGPRLDGDDPPMTDDRQEALEMAEAEIVRRLLDDGERQKLSGALLVRMAERLQKTLGQAEPETAEEPLSAAQTIARAGLPRERQIGLLMMTEGVTAEEAASLLAMATKEG